MRPRKIFGLLIPLLQIILLLKLVELVRGQGQVQEYGSPAVQYIQSVPYNQKLKGDEPGVPHSESDELPIYYDHRTGNVIANSAAAAASQFQSRSLPTYQQRKQTMYQRRHRRPYWSTTTTTTEPPTTIVVEEIIEYSENGTEINRENITKVVRLPPSNVVPLCPDDGKCVDKGQNLTKNSEMTETDLSRTIDKLIQALTSLIFGTTGQRQAQNVKQSTLLVLIAILKIVAGFIAFETFLLLWKINYYTVSDPYATAGPSFPTVPSSRKSESPAAMAFDQGEGLRWQTFILDAIEIGQAWLL